MSAADNKKAFDEFREYCKSLPDYKDIKPYLDADQSPFEPRIDSSVFIAGH